MNEVTNEIDVNVIHVIYRSHRQPASVLRNRLVVTYERS
jgi:hypothetical protein